MCFGLLLLTFISFLFDSSIFNNFSLYVELNLKNHNNYQGLDENYFVLSSILLHFVRFAMRLYVRNDMFVSL